MSHPRSRFGRLSCRAALLALVPFGIAALDLGSSASRASAAEPAKPVPAKSVLVVEGVVNPESVVVGADGRTYISCIGERDKDGDGIVAVVVDGKAVSFATGFDDPKGIVSFGDRLFVADKTRVWAIERDGKASVYAAKDAFPVEPLFLNDVAVDAAGTLYVSDSGLKDGGKGKVYSIAPAAGGKAPVVALVVDETKVDGLKRPNGVLIARDKSLLLADAIAGKLYRIALPPGEVEILAEGLGRPDGIVEDAAGNLFVSDVAGGKIHRVLPRNREPVLIAEGFSSAADIAMAGDGKSLLVPDMKSGKLHQQPLGPAVAIAPLVTGLKNPESVAWSAADNTLYVTVIGEFGVDGDGLVMAYAHGKPAKVFAKGLNDPKGITIFKEELYLTDKTRIVKIDKEGTVKVVMREDQFEPKPTFLNDISYDVEGSFVVTDSGDDDGKGAAVYGVLLDAGFLTGAGPLFEPATSPLVKRPNGVLMDLKKVALWVVDFETGDLLRAPMDVDAPQLVKIAGGFPGGDGLALDDAGNLYISSWKTGELWTLPEGAKEGKLLTNQFVTAADICIDVKGGRIFVPDMKAGTVTEIPLPKK